MPRSKMTKAKTSLTLLTAVLALSGCYKALHATAHTDGSGPDTGGVDAQFSPIDALTSTGGRGGSGDASSGGSGGSVGVDALVTGSDDSSSSGGTSGSGGVGVDAPMTGSGGTSGSADASGSGGIGVDAPTSTGGRSGSGGASGSGGVGVDAPITCSSGYHNCNGTCVSNLALATCGLTECISACQAPTGGGVTCNGTACVPSCPTSAPQNCDGTCIAQTAPCGGKCLGGQKYCSTSNTCISSSGCCSPADCSAGGANTVAICTNSTCGIACSSASYSMCGTSCTDLSSDSNNCRTCGSRCGTSTPKCLSGTCVQCLTTGDCSGNKVCSGNQCTCPNTDGACGAGCTACSGSTLRCSGGTCVQCLTAADCSGNKVCSGNECVAPLACGDALPAVSFPTVYVASGTPPSPAGGAITEGVYALTKVTCYSSSYSSVSGDSFQLQNGAFHLRHVTYSTSGSALTGYEELGTYAASGAAMAIDVTLCGTSNTAQALWKYTASSTQIETFSGSASDTCIETFALQQ